MRFELTEEEDIVSEMVHDMDSDYQEKLCHYVHYFLMNKISKDELEKAFNALVKGYEHMESFDGYVPDPWEE